MSSAIGPSAGRSLQLVGDQRDRGQRRAELVGRRRRQPVELREMLLARQHQLRRGQRLAELARLLRDPPGIDADERERRAGWRTRSPARYVSGNESISPAFQGSGR